MLWAHGDEQREWKEKEKRNIIIGDTLFCTSWCRRHELAKTMGLSKGVPKHFAMCKIQCALQKRVSPFTRTDLSLSMYINFNLTGQKRSPRFDILALKTETLHFLVNWKIHTDLIIFTSFFKAQIPAPRREINTIKV